MEHDPKNRVIHYVKDERFLPTGNTLHVEATDKVGNKTELRVEVR